MLRQNTPNDNPIPPQKIPNFPKCLMPKLNFQWQSRFHDHIIRNEKSFIRISNYIINNLIKWQEDRFFPSLTNCEE